MRGRSRQLVPFVMVLALLAGACGSGSAGGDRAGGTVAGARDLPPCPLDALDKAAQPVEVVVWHSYAAKVNQTLNDLAATFNASQSKVRVRVENQGTSYGELWKKYQTAAQSKSLPAIAILEDIDTRSVADSGTVLPAQSCIDAAKVDMSDFVKPGIDFYSIDGALYPATLNLSSPLVYYNRNHFRRAGLDPNTPPKTLDEVRAYAAKIKAAGIVDKPLVLNMQPWFFETWLTGARSPVVNNDNGRGTGTTDAATFNSPEAMRIMTWLDGMVRDGLVDPIPYTGGGVNQYLAMANQKASMTLETSTAATSIKAFLKGDTSVAAGNDTSNVDLNALDINAGEFPGLDAPGKVQISGGAWYITSTTPPEVQAAAWTFIQWWNRVDTQVRWHLDGSYLPFRRSAADDPAVRKAWTEDLAGRWLALSWKQLNAVDPTFPGPMIGPYDTVRDTMTKALDRVAVEQADPRAALDEANQKATEAIRGYDARK